MIVPTASAQTDTSRHLAGRVWEYLFPQKEKPVESRQRNAEENTLINRYDQLYRLFQGDAQYSFDSLQRLGVISYDSTLESFTRIQPNGDRLDSMIVFGWHPFWMNRYFGNYQVNLLSHLSYYGYIIDPNSGKAVNDEDINSWVQSDFMKKAGENPSAKVLITVVNYGEENNRRLLHNGLDQQAELIRQLDTILQKTGAQGVDLNFEGINPADASAFTAFVRDLTYQLHTENREYIVSISISSRDFDALEIKPLQEMASFFVLMGYGFKTDRDTIPGAVAPLTSGRMNLSTEVDKLLRMGLRSENLVLGLPYFGAQWKKVDNRRQFDQYLTYRQIRTRLGANSPEYFSDSTEAWYVAGDSLWMTFDDDITLTKKYRFAQEKHLKGVALWALGYDDGYLDLWGAINQQFTIKKETIAYPPQTLFNRIAVFTFQYKSIMIISFAYMLIFLILGFAVSLNYANVREALFQHNTWRLVIVLSVFIAPLLYYLVRYRDATTLPIGGDPAFMLFAGLMGGALLTNIIYFLYGKWKERLPRTGAVTQVKFSKNS